MGNCVLGSACLYCKDGLGSETQFSAFHSFGTVQITHTPAPGKKHNTTACVEWLVKWTLHHRFIHCIMFSLTFLVYIFSIYISFYLDGFSEVCGHESQNPMCIFMSFIVDHFNWINGVIFHTFICYNMEWHSINRLFVDRSKLLLHFDDILGYAVQSWTVEYSTRVLFSSHGCHFLKS